MIPKTSLRSVEDVGFAAFRAGEFGNAGQNLYVSKAGVLQRIHLFDVTGNGYVDIPFVNAHDDASRVPVHVRRDPLGANELQELPTEGAYAAAMGDLTGNGLDDLVIANQFDGASNDVYLQVYFRSAKGFDPQRMLMLWAPCARDVEVGDFNGDGRGDIAVVTRDTLRIFYSDERGLRPGDWVDVELDHDIESIVSADFDGDGYDDLVIRSADSSLRVYWGSRGGIDAGRRTAVPVALSGHRVLTARRDAAAAGAGALTVYTVPDYPRIKAVHRHGSSQLFLCRDGRAVFLGSEPDRVMHERLSIATGEVFSAAAGDLRGLGREDLVFAARQPGPGDSEQSWVYFADAVGRYDDRHKQSFDTRSANDVKIADLSGDGRADVVVCQDRTAEDYTTESLIYSVTSDGRLKHPARFATHAAVDAFATPPTGSGAAEVIFVNHVARTAQGHVPTRVYLGGPDGYSADRHIELTGWAAPEVKICDVNDDGRPDIYMANCDENMRGRQQNSYVFLAGVDGYDQERRLEVPTLHNMSGCWADLNRDGYLDLVAAGYSNDEVMIFPGSASGLGPPSVVKLDFGGRRFDQPRFMTLADLNRDGWLDLVVPECGPTGELIILWGGPDGFSNERASLLPCGSTICSRVADLNGNGWPDVIVGGHQGWDPGSHYSSFVYIYWGGPDGYSNANRTQLPADFPADIAVADLNGDGLLDLFVANYHAGRTRDIDSFIYWQDSEHRFSADRCQRLFHHSACGVLAADFNEDGYVDLAVANHRTRGNHESMSYVWWNGPDGFSPERRTELPTLGTHGITHSDPGNIMDRGPEEYFISRVLPVEDVGRAVGVSWGGDIPAKTWVRAQVRAARNATDLPTADWVGSAGPGTWLENGSPFEGPSGSYLQYRLALGAVNSGRTPRVTSVRVDYECAL